MVVDNRHFAEQVIDILKVGEQAILVTALIVEDSLTIGKILKKTFESKGYKTDIAISSQLALKTFSMNRYDVAVIDYHLPDGMGDILLDTFHKEQPECVCMMMTTDPTPALALDWIKRGAAAYVRKPFEPEYLLDLCDRARRERNLMKIQELLEIRNRELKASDDVLKVSQQQPNQAQKMEAIGRLAGGLAHDLNKMLTVIMENAEIVMATIDPAMPIFDELQEIYDAAQSSVTLTRQLLAFALKQTISPMKEDSSWLDEPTILTKELSVGKEASLAEDPPIAEESLLAENKSAFSA